MYETCAVTAISSAPRRWGYTLAKQPEEIQQKVCPTQVGIHPDIGIQFH